MPLSPLSVVDLWKWHIGLHQLVNGQVNPDIVLLIIEVERPYLYGNRQVNLY